MFWQKCLEGSLEQSGQARTVRTGPEVNWGPIWLLPGQDWSGSENISLRDWGTLTTSQSERERGGEGIVHCAPCLTLYVNMMNDKYELAELRGNPEFYTGWSVHCDGVRASQWASREQQSAGSATLCPCQPSQWWTSQPDWQPAPRYQVKEKHQISGVNTCNNVRIGDESSSSSSTIAHNLQLLTSDKNDDWNNSLWFIDVDMK